MQNHSDIGKIEFTEWIKTHSDMLFNFIKTRISDLYTAEDIFQDTLLAAWTSRGSYRAEARVSTWLIGIARNKIMDHYRAISKDLDRVIKIYTEFEDFFNEMGMWKEGKSPKEWKTQEWTADEKEDFYLVMDSCKLKLNALQQAVFSLKYIDDKNSDEICKELGISPSNYWVLMHRGKLQLRECLEVNYFAYE